MRHFVQLIVRNNIIISILIIILILIHLLCFVFILFLVYIVSETLQKISLIVCIGLHGMMLMQDNLNYLAYFV